MSRLLRAQLAAAWEAEMRAAVALEALSERASNSRQRARLGSLATECHARGVRLMARMPALGGGLLPVPPDEAESAGEFADVARREAAFLRALSDRYARIEDASRESDPACAYVCGIGWREARDAANELEAMAAGCASTLVRGEPW